MDSLKQTILPNHFKRLVLIIMDHGSNFVFLKLFSFFYNSWLSNVENKCYNSGETKNQVVMTNPFLNIFCNVSGAAAPIFKQ